MGKLLNKYDLDTPKGVYLLLSNIHQLSNARYFDANFDACDLLLDLKFATYKVTLTDRQAEAINYFFIEELNQLETAQKMDCTQQAVQQFIRAAVNKIANEFEKQKLAQEVANKVGGFNNE